MQLPDIVRPQKIEKNISSDLTCGKFEISPFEKGYGHTVGHSLRRILLSSLEGAAVVATRIKGASHEFTTLPGVVEDVMSIVLNLKKIRFKTYGTDELQTLKLSVSKGGAVLASSFETNSNIEIVNPNFVIATLETGGTLDMEIDVAKGRGYLPAGKNKRYGQPVGTIFVDALFSPITKVFYEVEATRVGQATDYDRLIMEIWTDGSVNPEDALIFSAKLLNDSIKVFMNYDEDEKVSPQVLEKSISIESNESDEPYSDILNQPVEIIELSNRAANCLKQAKIKTIGELAKKTKEKLLVYKNFGKKSLDEIEMKLKEMGVSLKESEEQ
ncbi:MAG: DNA-directed RNA polymerase subunit alpha [Elusimicrobiota bacterium]